MNQFCVFITSWLIKVIVGIKHREPEIKYVLGSQNLVKNEWKGNEMGNVGWIMGG